MLLVIVPPFSVEIKNNNLKHFIAVPDDLRGRRGRGASVEDDEGLI